MFAPTFWTLFLLAAVVINLTPGPDMLYLLGKSCAHGRRLGLFAVLGLWSGAFVHVIAAAAGLSAILMASAEAFLLVKLLGAAYLCWLGVQAIRQAGQGLVADEVGNGSPRALPAFRQGVLIAVLNPKTALFFMAFLPQFVRPELAAALPISLQLLLLGSLVIVVAIPIELTLVLGASALSRWLRERKRLAVWLDRLLGVMFVGLAARLVSSAQRGT